MLCEVITDGSGFPADGPKGTEIPMDARVLHILTALANVAHGPEPERTDFETLSLRAETFDPTLFARIRKALEIATDKGRTGRATRTLATGLLLPDMTLAADVVTVDGRLVLSAEVQISAAHVESLRNLARLRRIPDAVAVLVEEEAAPV